MSQYPSETLDTTPEIIESSTPNVSFNASMDDHNHVGLSPVRKIVSGVLSINKEALFGTYVIDNESKFHCFNTFCFFVYILSLIILFALVLGPYCEGQYSDYSTLSFEGFSSLSDSTESSPNLTMNSEHEDNAHEILLNLRKKNVNRVIIGTLNINTVLNKLEQLAVISWKFP